jgi:hypothetical protein
VLRQQAGIFRIAAGNTSAQQNADGLALEEGGFLGEAGTDRQDGKRNAEDQSRAQTHDFRSLDFRSHGSPLAGAIIAAS